MPKVVNSLTHPSNRKPNFERLILDQYAKLPQMVNIYASVKQYLFDNYIQTGVWGEGAEWTLDEGRAECCAFYDSWHFCKFIKESCDNIVIKVTLPKEYINLIDDYFYYITLDVAKAIKNGIFNPVFLCDQPTSGFDKFMDEESERRFK